MESGALRLPRLSCAAESDRISSNFDSVAAAARDCHVMTTADRRGWILVPSRKLGGRPEARNAPPLASVDAPEGEASFKDLGARKPALLEKAAPRSVRGGAVSSDSKKQ